MNVKRLSKLLLKRARSERARRIRVLNVSLKESKKGVLDVLIRRFVSSGPELDYYLRLLREL